MQACFTAAIAASANPNTGRVNHRPDNAEARDRLGDFPGSRDILDQSSVSLNVQKTLPDRR
jgi:hypothetical protein